MTDLLTRYRIIRTAIPSVFILWTILMLLLTLLPGDSLPSARLFSYDKIGHFGMFGGWTFFLGLYMIVYRQKADINLFLLMMAGILFGAAIEGMQYLMPLGRAASWGDIAANSLGCFAAYLMLHPVRSFLKREK
jgi:VanZ family protein